MADTTRKEGGDAFWSEMQRVLQSPSDPECDTDDVRRECLMSFETQPPLRQIRALALYRELRRYGDTASQEDWEKAAEQVRMTRSQTEHAIEDLVQHAIAALRLDDGQITLKLLVTVPELEEATEVSDGGN